jgi:hypothetical protein
MGSSEMLRRVALVRSDVPEELSASFIRVTRIGELGTTLAVPSSPILTLMKEALSSSEIPEDTILQRRNVSPVRYELGFYIPENDILHSHRRENLKSYISTKLLSISFKNAPF